MWYIWNVMYVRFNRVNRFSLSCVYKIICICPFLESEEASTGGRIDASNTDDRCREREHHAFWFESSAWKQGASIDKDPHYSSC